MKLLSESMILYIAILVFIALTLLLTALVIAYLRLVNKYLELKEAKEKGVDPEELLSAARIKSQKILEEAIIRANKIISQSQVFLEEHNKDLLQILNKVSEMYAKRYQESLGLVQEEAIKMLQNIPNDLKVFMVSAIDGFRETLTKEVEKTQKEVADSLRESIIAAQHEIERYKEERKREIDERIVEYVAEVTKRVLRKEISIDEHEKLVLKALEEAKRQGIFKS